MKLFGKIPLYVNQTFWLLAAIIGYSYSYTFSEFAVWVTVVFVSVLVHELGHALSALFFKQSSFIELGPYGGVTVRRGKPLKKFKEFIVVLMGPLFGFLLAGLSYYMFLKHPVQDMYRYAFSVAFSANIFWSTINLIPVHPLDGGKLMSITLESLFGLWGVRFSYFLSALFGIFFAVYCALRGELLAVMLLVLFVYESIRAFMDERHVRTSGEDEKVIDEVVVAENEWGRGDRDLAIERLKKLVDTQVRGEAYYQALETLVGFLLADERISDAYEYLQRVKKNLTGTLLKQMQVASYKLGLWDEAVEYGKKYYLADQDPTIAVLNAFSMAAVEKADEAVLWLKAAYKKQEELVKKVLGAKEFDSIRSTADFVKLERFVNK